MHPYSWSTMHNDIKSIITRNEFTHTSKQYGSIQCTDVHCLVDTLKVSLGGLRTRECIPLSSCTYGYHNQFKYPTMYPKVARVPPINTSFPLSYSSPILSGWNSGIHTIKNLYCINIMTLTWYHINTYLIHQLEEEWDREISSSLGYWSS